MHSYDYWISMLQTFFIIWYLTQNFDQCDCAVKNKAKMRITFLILFMLKQTNYLIRSGSNHGGNCTFLHLWSFFCHVSSPSIQSNYWQSPFFPTPHSHILLHPQRGGTGAGHFGQFRSIHKRTSPYIILHCWIQEKLILVLLEKK